MSGWRARPAKDERGAVAVIVTLMATSLIVVTSLVVDFAQVRLDRQASKSAADSAVMAGLQAADGDTADIFTVRGVCGALDFLRVNEPALGGLPTGTQCAGSPATSNVVCDPANTTAALTNYQQSVTSGGVTYSVQIKSPYDVSEGSFPEESYPGLSSDTSTMNGCDQIAVIIKKSRPPMFGRIVSDQALESTIRSVGRVSVGPGDTAPAMLLLKQTGCPILQTGSNSASTIRLFGAVSSDGRSQAGTIHADSTGSGCSGGSNANIFLGKSANGIVALAAPLVSDQTQPDPAKPGIISSVAALNGHGQGVGYDSAANVFGSGAVNDAGIGGASKLPPVGRSIITRKLVDERYFAGIKGVRSAASSVFANISAGNAATNGYKVLTGCNPTSGAVSALSLTAADRLFVDCTANNGYNGAVPLAAGTVIFNGSLNPSAVLSLPNATKVYVHGSSSRAIVLTGGGGLSMHTSANIDPATAQCSNATTSAANKAVLVIKSGDIKQSTGGKLTACYTTMLMMGGHANTACIPDLPGRAPTQSPCTSGMGNGQLSQTGGDVDWTAPNSLDVTTDVATGDPLPAAVAGWGDPNGPEDLAFWSESAGNNSSTTYNMNGQGILHTVGVYMVPNADSFSIGGGSTQILTNAQYIATSIALNGNGTRIEMKVDPNSAVTLPELTPFTLVR